VDPAHDPQINPNYPSAPPWRGATGQKGVINAWNGGAFASRVGRLGSQVVFGGGHNRSMTSSSTRTSSNYWPRTAGAAVHELRLRGSDWRGGVWWWSALTSPDNEVVPQPMTAENRVYGRFRLARFSNAEIALVVNRVDGPLYAFRTPDAGLAN
jgi:hypothetical protein